MPSANIAGHMYNINESGIVITKQESVCKFISWRRIDCVDYTEEAVLFAKLLRNHIKK
ncbi:hypothetical protein GCM10008022_20620 [Paenibacillus hunanensis]|uniref:Uncharacterized protein n=1 Tax=Paenibacillus hunanensis TaxID=539262 RepID=A0ABU1IXQ9_9BACL|nr:hypothetical protein [Paenibacillus hunanensis]GGJ11342.1 hypothetical protein GCM10008022_20620 [Paenibacillus hunanensis]